MLFLEFPCFFCDVVDIGNLISGSSAFSKSNLYIWKFSVHILLKPGLKNLFDLSETDRLIMGHQITMEFELPIMNWVSSGLSSRKAECA